MNRRKSSLPQYIVLVVGAYLGLFHVLDGYAPTTELLAETDLGSPDVEWVELEPPQGEPLPSSTPDETVPPKVEVEPSVEPQEVLAAPEPPTPQPVPAPMEEPKPKDILAAPSPKAKAMPEPVSTEEMKSAWTDPESEIAAPVDSEPSKESHSARIRDAEEEARFRSMLDKEVEVAQAAPETVTATDSQKTQHPLPPKSSPSLASRTQEKPSFGNPYVDPNAPPIGRSGVLDARSLRPAAGNPPPSYPVTDRLARREGEVILLGYVTKNGRLTRVTVEREAISSAMTQGSFRTFKDYRFRPGQEGWVRQTFRFTLRGDPQEIKGTLRGS